MFCLIYYYYEVNSFIFCASKETNDLFGAFCKFYYCGHIFSDSRGIFSRPSRKILDSGSNTKV